MDSLLQAKIEAIFVTLALALTFGMLPIKVRKYLLDQSRIPQKYTNITLSACLCFGAGVLLATTFLHMLPENIEHIEALIAKGVITIDKYPLSELIMCLGFLFIYLMEELVHLSVHHHPVGGNGGHTCGAHHNSGYDDTHGTMHHDPGHSHRHDSCHSHQHDPGHSHQHDLGHSHQHDIGHSHQHDPGHSHQHDLGHSHQHDPGHSHQHDLGHSHQHDSCHSHQHDPGHSHQQQTVKVKPRAEFNNNNNSRCIELEHSGDTNKKRLDCFVNATKGESDAELCLALPSCHTPCENPQLSVLKQSRKRCESISSVAIIAGCLDQQLPTICVQVATDDCNSLTSNDDDKLLEAYRLQKAKHSVSLVRSALVVLALSFHGTFEGLALGLETTVTGVWIFCLAICLHKVFIAFSIGMELLELNISNKLYILYMTVFSLSTPFGGALGTTLFAVFSEQNTAGLITMTILEGLSAGTILYVTFCEVLERERTKVDGRFVKYLSLAMGFAIMAGLQVL